MATFKIIPHLITRTPLLPENTSLTEADIVNTFYSNEIVQTAIYIASPSLYHSLKKSEASGKVEKRILCSLYKYIARMSRRCTPYGIFAATNIVEWNETELSLYQSVGKIKPRVRMDMAVIRGIVREISSKLNYSVKYYLNNTGYYLNNKFIYLGYDMSTSARSQKIQSVDLNEYLIPILEKAEEGIYLKDGIELLLKLDDELQKEEVEMYFEDLVENAILQTDLEPNVTGVNYMDRLLDLDFKQQSIESIDQLKYMQKELKQMSKPNVINFNRLNRVYQFAQENFKNVPSEKNFFQVDTTKVLQKTKQTVNVESIQKNLIEVCNFLYGFKQEFSDPNSDLEVFKQKFSTRYEDKFVPLTEVLDSETGIGYPVGPSKVPSYLTKGVQSIQDNDGTYRFAMSGLQQAVLEEIKTNGYEKAVDLSKIKIEHEPTTKSYIEGLFCGMISLLDGDLVMLKGLGRATGLDLLTRFADVDPSISNTVDALAKIENDFISKYDFVPAEFCHLPNDRMGNIIVRPSVRPYEIPHLSLSEKEADEQILVKDLMVYLDRATNTFRVVSKKMKRHLYVTHSSAFNYTMSKNPVYRFLCDLQFQQRPVMQYRDGPLHSLFKTIPRVVYKNIMLSRHSWVFSKADINKIASCSFVEFDAWRKEKKIYDEVLIKDYDNELYFDLNDPFSVEVLISEIKSKSFAILCEFIEADAKYSLKDEAGLKYSNEFIVPFTYTPDESNTLKLNEVRAEDLNSNARSGSMFHGGEWTYYKIYCGVNIANEIIIKLHHILKEQQWFFIRFLDHNGEHLRVRFKENDPIRKLELTERLFAMVKPYFNDGFVSNLTSDIYHRELRRYGEETIDDCEAIFHYDSVTTALITDQIGKTITYHDLWKVAFLSLDNYLNAYQFNLQQKLEFCELSKKYYGFEFNLKNKDNRESLKRKFRALRPELMKAMKEDTELPEIKQLIDQRFEHAKPMFDKLTQHNTNILVSLFHMSVNRLFKSEQRFSEFIIYYCARNYYSSEIAMMKNRKKAKTNV